MKLAAPAHAVKVQHALHTQHGLPALAPPARLGQQPSRPVLLLTCLAHMFPGCCTCTSLRCQNCTYLTMLQKVRCCAPACSLAPVFTTNGPTPDAGTRWQTHRSSGALTAAKPVRLPPQARPMQLPASGRRTAVRRWVPCLGSLGCSLHLQDHHWAVWLQPAFAASPLKCSPTTPLAHSLPHEWRSYWLMRNTVLLMFMSTPGNEVQQASFAIIFVAALWNEKAAVARQCCASRHSPACIDSHTVPGLLCALTVLHNMQTTVTTPRRALKASPTGPPRQE